MTPDSPEFLEALADARDVPIMVAPAVLRECAAAWRQHLACLARAYRIMGDSAESVAYWRAYCERQVEEGGDIQQAPSRTLAAAGGESDTMTDADILTDRPGYERALLLQALHDVAWDCWIRHGTKQTIGNAYSFDEWLFALIQGASARLERHCGDLPERQLKEFVDVAERLARFDAGEDVYGSPACGDPPAPPVETFAPGEFIREELAVRGWTVTALALYMGRMEWWVRDLIAGKQAVTPEVAGELSACFGTSADLWLNLERKYRGGAVVG